MSKGLGANYLSEYMVSWHKDDLLNRQYVNIIGGKKAAMPRYYKDRLYTEAERQKIKIHSFGRIFEKLRQQYNASATGDILTAMKKVREYEKYVISLPVKDNL